MAFVWSQAAHYGMGVPFDLVQRARRNGGQAEVDLEDMVRINCTRALRIGSVSGLWLTGFVFFALTGLAVLGFSFGIHFAQAVFLILCPMALVGAMALSLASQIVNRDLNGEDLHYLLTRHRYHIQVVGIVSIFITATWGMYQNLTLDGFFG